MNASLSIRGGTVDVDIVAGRIVADRSEVRGDPRLDASGCTVVPGFVDVQINGGFGIDLTCEPERVDELAALLPQTGVTAFAPTVVTAEPEVTARAVDLIGRRRQRPAGSARSLGVHLEGPFLNPARKGAHPERHLRLPSLAEASGWSAAGGVSMVTLAPELPGALDVVRRLARNGVAVCIGHTAATPAEVDAAFAAGATGATHLYNAMGPFGAREPNTVGALLASRSAICGLIVDGVHVEPLMVAVAWRALGSGHVALVTDAISALGLGSGAYRIGATEVVVDETSARTRAGVLAGSVLRMDEAVRNLVAFTGCSAGDAARAASRTPARLLRQPGLGRLTRGGIGDVVLLDTDLRVAATVVGGHIAYDRDGRAR